MQAISGANRYRGHHLAVLPAQDQQPASTLGLPLQRIHHCAFSKKQGIYVEQVRTHIENGIVFANAEVVHRARKVQRGAFSEAQAFRTKAIKIKPGRLREKYPEVEHLPRVRIEFGMR